MSLAHLFTAILYSVPNSLKIERPPSARKFRWRLSDKCNTYHLYGNFGEKFPSNDPSIFLTPKTGTGLSCPIYRIPVNLSLSLERKPGTGNPQKWYRKFRSFRQSGKKATPRKILPSSWKISTRMNCSIWILTGIAGFSIQMVSAQSHTSDPSIKLTVQIKEQHKRVFWPENERRKLTSFNIRMVTRNHRWRWSVFVFVFLILLFSWKRLYRCRTFFFISLLREFPSMDTNRQFSTKKNEAP